MSRWIIPLDKISPTTTGWTARVKLISKKPTKTSQNSPVKFQKLVLADEEGNSVEATIFNNVIKLFKDKLEEQKTYEISYALVKSVNEKYRNPIATCDYEWIITQRTSISPVDEVFVPPSKFIQEFADSGEFESLMVCEELFNIICVILESRTRRKLKRDSKLHILHEYAAIDMRMKPFVITLWDDVLEKETYEFLSVANARPIAGFLNVKISDFYGVGVTSTCSTIAITNLGNADFVQMQQWKNLNKKPLDEIVRQDGLFEKKLPHLDSNSVKAVNISQITNEDKDDKYYVISQAKIVDEDQPFFYMSCEECFCGIGLPSGTVFMCTTCDAKRKAIPRYKYRMTVYDETGEIDVVVFREQAQALLGIEIDDFYRDYSADSSSAVMILKNNLENTTLHLRIRSSTFENESTGERIISYSILALNCFSQDESSQIKDPSVSNVARRLSFDLSKEANGISAPSVSTKFPGMLKKAIPQCSGASTDLGVMLNIEKSKSHTVVFAETPPLILHDLYLEKLFFRQCVVADEGQGIRLNASKRIRILKPEKD